MRKNIDTKEGKIEHTPTLDNHITNKKYVDDEIGPYHPHQSVKTTASPSFATYVEMYFYSQATGYEFFERKQLTLQPGQLQFLAFQVEGRNFNDIIGDDATTTITIRVKDPLLDPLREPIDQRSRKVEWVPKLPNDLPTN